ncbi:MAG TPA: crosslink repair DNA glycosylase YcaQ family protein [Candidatus Baltobacteraceae bacterium]|nr:crosslink repair DNA glycosylase YcaQ family protein [Candidatus Baltobacteraceae bacterium]
MTFLAPLDPLCWDRDLLRLLYGFDYVWEVYVPEARRRWGYYVLPLLFGDRLVGRIEPRIDRRTGHVTILGLWWEAGFDPRRADGFVPAMRTALTDYLAFAEARTLAWSDQAARWGRLLSPPRRRSKVKIAAP